MESAKRAMRGKRLQFAVIESGREEVFFAVPGFSAWMEMGGRCRFVVN